MALCMADITVGITLFEIGFSSWGMSRRIMRQETTHPHEPEICIVAQFSVFIRKETLRKDVP